MSLAYLVTKAEKTKKNLELRVYSVKSGLMGHASYVYSTIVHFSSGGETIPQSVVPKHSASRSQGAPYFPQSCSLRSTGDHEPTHGSRNAPVPVFFVSALHTTDRKSVV